MATPAISLWAVGLIGAKIHSVPTLIDAAAYAVSHALGWRHGLDEEPRVAKQFYGIIIIATPVGMTINFLGVNPINALVFTSILNGFLVPFLLTAIRFIS